MKWPPTSWELLRHLSRATPWTIVVSGGLAAVAAAALLVPPSVWTVESHLVPTRWASVALAAALASSLDTDLGPDLDALGVARWWRRAQALGLVLPVVAAAWWWVLVLPAPDLPWQGLTVEGLAVAAVGMGAASLPTVRRRGASAVVVAAVAGACLLVAAQLLPPHLELLATPAGPEGWAAAHRRWTVVLVAGVGLTCWGWRDPARRHLQPDLMRTQRPTPDLPLSADPAIDRSRT